MVPFLKGVSTGEESPITAQILADVIAEAIPSVSSDAHERFRQLAQGAGGMSDRVQHSKYVSIDQTPQRPYLLRGR